MKAGMKWISIKDRLPDDLVYVLVKCSGFAPSGFEIAYYEPFDGSFESQANGDIINEYVTHWMELPKLINK